MALAMKKSSYELFEGAIKRESTALLLAGVQSTTWMIPAVLSTLGIGLFVVSRKSKNS
jgi:hypothetical protein